MKLSAGDCDVHFYTQLVILFDLLLFFFFALSFGNSFHGRYYYGEKRWCSDFKKIPSLLQFSCMAIICYFLACYTPILGLFISIFNCFPKSKSIFISIL